MSKHVNLEKELVQHLVCKLDNMMNAYVAGAYHDGCALQHLAEMVKLVHQVRSLTPKK